MDFHSLPRRSLQSLCKRNKIPANLTNVAMADALNSLQSVEGLDELFEQQIPTSVVTSRPRNPIRSCRKTNPSVDDRKLTPKTRRNSTAGEETIENPLPLSYLLPCSEKASSLKHMSNCTENVRVNVSQVEKRSVGIQVDTQEKENSLVKNLAENHLDFDACDDILIRKEQENDLCIVHEIEVRDKGCIDALVSMQNVQDSNNSCEPIANNMGQISEVVNDDVKIVTNECINRKSEIPVDDCIETLSLENIQVNTTLKESGLQSANISLRKSEISIGDINLVSDLDNVPRLIVSGDNMDVPDEEIWHKEETHSQISIQKDQNIYFTECDGISSFRSVQVAIPPRVPSPKSVVLEATNTVGIDSIHGFGYDRDEKKQCNSILSESRKSDDMEKVNEETKFETITISDTDADGCLDNFKEFEKACSLLTEAHELNMSMLCSELEHDVVARNEEDGERKCNSEQVITLLQRPNPKCLILKSDDNVGINSNYAKDCIDTSALQNDEVSTTLKEHDLKSMNLSFDGQQVSTGDIELNLDLNSDKNERDGSLSTPLKNVLADNMDVLNEESEHDEDADRQNFIQKDQDVYVKECDDISSLQNVQMNTLPQLPSPKRIILQTDSIVGVDSIKGLEYDRDEKMLSSCILTESLKVECIDNVKEVSESTLLSTSEIRVSNMDVVCSALKLDDGLAYNGDNSERKYNKSGENMSIEIKKEPQCNKKRKHLGELSLRKLRLIYKKNKEEVIRLEIENNSKRNANICCGKEATNKEKSSDVSCKEKTRKKEEIGDIFGKEEISKKEEIGDIYGKKEIDKKEEIGNIYGKEESGKKEEIGNICGKEETGKKEEFVNISLRKLRLMLKNKAKKH